MNPFPIKPAGRRRAAPRGHATLQSLQYIRAVAALAVVGFHQLQQFAALRVGQHGVDLFFTISGFIMIALTERRPVTPGRFLLDRCARIVPTYWVATLATAMLTQAGIYSPFVVSRGAAHLLKSLLFIPDFDASGHLRPTLFLGWTLNYEAFFYGLFALALFAGARLRLLLMTIILLGLVAAGRLHPGTSAVAHVYTNPLLLEFLGGMCLGSVFGMTLRKFPLPATLGVVCGLLVIMAALGMLMQSLLWGAASLLIVSSVVVLERLERLPHVAFLRRIGDASYSVYLFQQIAFDLTWAAIHAAGLPHDPAAHRLLCSCLAIAAAIVFGLLAHALVEKPLTRAARRLLSRLTPVPADLATTTACIRTRP